MCESFIRKLIPRHSDKIRCQGSDLNRRQLPASTNRWPLSVFSRVIEAFGSLPGCPAVYPASELPWHRLGRPIGSPLKNFPRTKLWFCQVLVTRRDSTSILLLGGLPSLLPVS